jgi:Zn-dependent protease with chaperone function
MKKLVYRHENWLFWTHFVLSTLFWGWVLLITKGMALLFLPVFFLLYLFGQSAFISHLRGGGALISAGQFPDLNERVQSCAKKLEMKKVPAAYILNGNGVLNAFATQFLRRHYIVLLSNVVDALQENPDALNFYIGHELGHIKRRHVAWMSYLAPASILPLLGAAYSRAREYTCDLHGARCCESPLSAQQALAALAVGSRLWKDVNLKTYLTQVNETKGFWMSFHELLASYPWLTKRVARVSPEFPQDRMPRRNPFAWLLCLFIPRPSLTTVIVIYLAIIFAGVNAAEKNVPWYMKMAMPSPHHGTAQLPPMPAVDPDAGPDAPDIPGAPVMPDIPDNGYPK